MGLTIQSIFPIITTTISLFFFVSVFEQWRRKGSTHQAVWSIAMLLFALTAGAEGFSIILGYWIPWVYRTYYVLAAIQVSFMGGGVLYLFASRNIINERNTHKAFLLFAAAWAFFAYLFTARSSIFLLILLPSLFIIFSSLIYFIYNYVDQGRYGEQLLCTYCRSKVNTVNNKDKKDDTCPNCQKSGMIEKVTESGRYRSLWHKYITGSFFAHFFLAFSLFIFFLMNIYAWTAPLNEGLLQTGREVSGLGWQDPSNPDGPRALVRLFSPLHTVPGAIALIGGGFFSYISWQLSIKRKTGHFEPHTGFFNVNIAVGAYVLGQGALLSGWGYTLGEIISFLPSSLASVGTLYFSEVISVSLMYYGFLGSDKLSKEKLLSAITLGLFRNESYSMA